MALADVLRQINELLPSGVKAQIGAEHLGEIVAPPRVLWVPTTDTYRAPPNKRWTRRPIMSRHTGVACHIWAVGSDAANPTAEVEELLEHVLGAIHRVAYGSYELPNPGGFQKQDGSEITAAGRLYIFAVAFHLPVLELETKVLAFGANAESTVALLDNTETVTWDEPETTPPQLPNPEP